jgi:hypothetical protein
VWVVGGGERRAVPRCVNKPRSTWSDYHVNLGVRPAQGLAATSWTTLKITGGLRATDRHYWSFISIIVFFSRILCESLKQIIFMLFRYHGFRPPVNWVPAISIGRKTLVGNPYYYKMFYLGKHTGGDRSEVISALRHSPRHHYP